MPQAWNVTRVNGLLKYDHDCSGKDGNLFVWQLTVFDHLWKKAFFVILYFNKT